ncbi:MAG: hypothetical protein WAW11_03270 [Patescibacteria group bacterium]
MFQQMEVVGAQKAPVKVEKIQYLIKGHDLNIPFSSDDGYDDKGAIARAQTMTGSPGLVLYKKVGKEPVTILYQPNKPKVFKKK